MATYEYDGVELTVGGNEVIRAGDMIALDARGQAVLAARARSTPVMGLGGRVLGLASDIPSAAVSGRSTEDALRAALLGDIPGSAGDAALGAAWERARPTISDVDALMAALRDLGSSVAATGFDGYMQRRAWRRRICADIDAAARKTPITAAELRARRFSRPLPRRRTRDGRLGPQAYAYEDPLPLP